MGDAQLALDLLMSRQVRRRVRVGRTAGGRERRSAAPSRPNCPKSPRRRPREIYHGQRALVVSGEGWHEGVKGIVASRLVNTYGVPALLFAIEGDEARGSGRSVGQINLFKAIESVADLTHAVRRARRGRGRHPARKEPAGVRPSVCARYMDALPEDAFHPLSRDGRVRATWTSSRWKTWRSWTRWHRSGRRTPCPASWHAT